MNRGAGPDCLRAFPLYYLSLSIRVEEDHDATHVPIMSPVPMAPPMAIIVIWREDRLR